MKKSQFIQLCEEYSVSPVSLKECIREEGLKRKTASTQDVLDVVYLYAPDLLWCRGAGHETVEYLDVKTTARLV